MSPWATLREPGTWPWLAAALATGTMTLWAPAWSWWQIITAATAIVGAGMLLGIFIDWLQDQRRRKNFFGG